MHNSFSWLFQRRCPYYRTAEHALYGTLTITGVNIGDSTGYADTYWDALPTTNLTNAQCGIDLPNFPNKFKSAFMTDPNNPACGQYLQFTSQYPGSGPCYPVLVPTVDHLNRYHGLAGAAAKLVQHCAACCASGSDMLVSWICVTIVCVLCHLNELQLHELCNSLCPSAVQKMLCSKGWLTKLT